MSRMGIAEIAERAAGIGALQNQLRAMAMMYQREAKETVADHYGLLVSQVDLPFAEWMALRERYERETGKKL